MARAARSKRTWKRTGPYKRIPVSQMVVKPTRRNPRGGFPINTIKRARNARARVRQGHHPKSLQRRVFSMTARRYPALRKRDQAKSRTRSRSPRRRSRRR